MDPEFVKTTLDVITRFFLPVGTLVYTWIATRDKDNSEHIRKVEIALDAAVASNMARITAIEQAMIHMPRAAETAGLKGDLRAMEANVSAMLRELAATRAGMMRIEDFLLKARES